MQSTLTPEEADPHDVFEIAPGVVLSARADHASPALAPDAVSHPSAPQAAMHPDVMASAAAPVPPVDTKFRATSVDDLLVQSDRTSTERWVGRAVMSLFAMCVAVAAAAWQHYGDTAKQMITSWAPPFVVTSSPPAQKPPLAAQPAPPAVQAAAQASATNPAPVPSVAPVAPAAAATPAPAPAVASTDATQLQSMTRDLASMGQQIEQLKASIAQLRAGQEQMAQQMSRDFVRTSEAKTAEHPRISPLPPRSAAAPLRKPRPAFAPAPTAAVSPLPPPQAAVAPLPPPPAPSPQATIQPDGESVVRPPLPVR